MHEAINYNQLTNMQPLFKQWQPLKTRPSSFIYDHGVMWYLPLVSLGQLSHLGTLSASYLLPTHLLVGREGETEKALTLCTRCLAITKPLVYYNSFGYKYKS